LISRRFFIAALIGVCVASAGIGAGVTMLAKTGPSGPSGERGPVGPQGPEGPEGFIDPDEFNTDFLESEVSELRELVEETEGYEEELESDVSSVESTLSEVCSEINLYC
jgi:hypothetical protein